VTQYENQDCIKHKDKNRLVYPPPPPHPLNNPPQSAGLLEESGLWTRSGKGGQLYTSIKPLLTCNILSVVQIYYLIYIYIFTARVKKKETRQKLLGRGKGEGELTFRQKDEKNERLGWGGGEGEQ
jgi:hypothetical protein